MAIIKVAYNNSVIKTLSEAATATVIVETAITGVC